MAGTRTGPAARRGRPPAGASAGHRQVVLDAAFELLVERGYQGATMAAVAQRAGSSKETLYAWFGDKPGLFTALIRREAEAANQAVEAALDGLAGQTGEPDPAETLTGFATNLLTLLLGQRSVALNRAAMAELGDGKLPGGARGRLPGGARGSELARCLLAEGRHRTGPIVETYLARLAEQGQLDIDDPAEAFQLLYGLVVRDLQIRVLLGEPPPGRAAMAAHANAAVDQFLSLAGSRPGGRTHRGRPL